MQNAISARGEYTRPPTKTAAIRDTPCPRATKEVHIFLVVASWYRRVVLAFRKLLKPIYDLIKKGTKFKRENKHEDATHGLKQALTKAPVLSCPDFAEIFVLQADASDCGFGAFLTPESADEE